MTLTPRTVSIFGYVSLAVMVTLLLLLWLHIVPDTMAVPFFVIAVVLFLTRIVIRFIVARRERKALTGTQDRSET